MDTARRRHLQQLLALGAAGAALGAPASARAQGKTLRMVVPFTPGTTPDAVARAIGPGMQQRLGAAYVVDNRAGASGMIGMGQVNQATDGATLMITPATTLTLPHFYKKVDFDVIKGFTPLTQVCSGSFVLTVIPGVPANNVQEFVAWAKANPGAFYSSPGAGTHHHLCMELFKQVSGVQLDHVRYKGAANAVTDFLAGQIPAMFMPINVAAPLRDTKRLKILGGTLKTRHPAFPDIPSIAEQGFKDYEVDPWYGAWAPPGAAAADVARWRDAIVASLREPDTRSTLTKSGVIIATSTPDELLKKAQAEAALWSRVIKAANIQPE